MTDEAIPEKGQVVICTVKKVFHHSVFLSLDEFPDYEGMLHISELAYKYVKNIHSYVKEGKTLICKVIEVNPAKKQADLSLRRVKAFEKKDKLEEWKHEKKAQKILEIAFGDDVQGCRQVVKKVKDKYHYLSSVLDEPELVDEFIKNKKFSEEIKDLIEKAKTTKIPIIKVNLSVHSLGKKGVEDVRDFLEKISSEGTHENMKIGIKYLGAPNYLLSATVEEFKEGDRRLRGLLKKAEDWAKDKQLDFKYAKKK